MLHRLSWAGGAGRLQIRRVVIICLAEARNAHVSKCPEQQDGCGVLCPCRSANATPHIGNDTLALFLDVMQRYKLRK